jgi:hypothetical protein
MVAGDAFAAAFEKIAFPSLQAVNRHLDLRGYPVGTLPSQHAADGGALPIHVEVLSRRSAGWHNVHYITVNRLVFRIAKISLSLAVGGCAAWLLISRVPEAAQSPNGAQPTDIRSLSKALRENAVSPYRWLELAEGYEQAEDIPDARTCFRHAQDLAPNLPPVWIRAAAFHFRLGEKEQGLLAGAHAQSISDSSDAFLFQYYDRLVRDNPLVVRTLSGDKRTLTAWFKYSMAKGRPDDAALVWGELDRQRFTSRGLAIDYVGFLLDQHRYETAQSVWSGNQGANSIYNGGFEYDPSGCRLDWKITPLEAAEAARDESVAKEGRSCLRVHFRGTDNVSFQNVAQTVVVAPGTYRFSAWLKTDEITTDQGVRFSIVDAEAPQRFNLETEMVRGTNEWMELHSDLAVPAHTNLVNISVCRRPSEKFENKISGTVWIDAVSLIRTR